MKRLFAICAAAVVALWAGAVPAGADFGIEDAQLSFRNSLGEPSLQAGSHPFATRMRVDVETLLSEGLEFPEGKVEDLTITFPEGFAGNPLATPSCAAANFITIVPGPEKGPRPACPNSTALGIQAVKVAFDPVSPGEDEFLHVPLYNLVPPPGVAARVGFMVLGVPITVDGTLQAEHPYRTQAHATNISQAIFFYGSITTLWGDPGSPAHDLQRGSCLVVDKVSGPDEPVLSGDECPLDSGQRTAFTTAPRSCTGPLKTLVEAFSWPIWSLDPQGSLVPGPSLHDSFTAETPSGMVNCPALDFEASVSAQPTTDHAESPTGLQFDLAISDPGLTNPNEDATAFSDLRGAIVTLPEGVTVNPSQAEGLAVCSEADLARETASSPFGAGCPAASKVGTVEVETPLLEGETLKGSLFVAEPYENRFGSLIAVYQVFKLPERGIAIKLAGKVEPDPRTGQLVSTFGRAGEELPQAPFSEFRLRFREGGRSPLITPPACGTYTTKAVLIPWANPEDPFEATSSFHVTKGVGGTPCPPPGPQPFDPGMAAGTLNNDAGSHSPFHLRLTRRDGDQDLTRFDSTLPPGLVAKLAGVEMCPEVAIAQLELKTGMQELASPSCPASSKIGRVNGGAGVGSQLTYVKGSVYLAGPFAGAPLSVIGVVPAVAGPFDVGVISTRQALTLDPVTAQPRVDGARSEPIPHILAGIPLRVRDIQVDVDRPQFTLNPTSCDPMAIGAAIWGGGLDVFSSHDDAPVARSARFQAANCLNLGFKPRLAFTLRGGTERGDNPAFTAVLRPRSGDANLKRTVVRFPRATFLDQGHIRTVCTRVQFAADACPKGAIYGKVRVFTPLLDQPLEGPVYLRSSDNLLPDVVFDLKGLVDIEAAARADSVNGKLRVTFPAIPDAPVSKAIVRMLGGRKSLLVNSRDICAPIPRAIVAMEGHNGKERTLRPQMRAKACGGKAKRTRRR